MIVDTLRKAGWNGRAVRKLKPVVDRHSAHAALLLKYFVDAATVDAATRGVSPTFLADQFATRDSDQIPTLVGQARAALHL